jgi:predicted ATPase
MKLKSVDIKGYKSIDGITGTSVEFGDITVLLGANGVGKSNLVSFFSMLNHMMTGSLQNFVAERGFADSFLYYGSKITRQIGCKLEFEDKENTYSYQCKLTHAAGDIFIFSEETLSLTYQHNDKNEFHTIQLNPAVRESDLIEYVQRPKETPLKKVMALVILQQLSECKVYHFHDTSMTARVRGQGYILDNHYLSSDGGNLGAFLYRLKGDPETFPYYKKIVRYIQQAMPQFGDFDLAANERNQNYITLNWRDNKNQQFLFGPHQISDGSLRFMCLATLLLQPPTLLPKVIILDEPELGLHPSAIGYFASMVKTASKHAQVIIATQSPRLVDEFGLENIVVVERDRITDATTFSRKETHELLPWLEEYSLSELWEKNVIGGQP